MQLQLFPNSSLKILSFNVENLIPKLDDPQFLSLMEKHDLCLFTETWLATNDKIGLPSFWDFHFGRPKRTKCGRNSGGISVFIKKKLRPGIKVVSMEEGFVWMKFDKDFCSLKNHLFLCVAYIPPQYSKSVSSVNIDYFKGLTTGIARYTNCGDIMLTGDFNSRVGYVPVVSHEGFEDLDKFLPHHNSSYATGSVRATCDSVQNGYGRCLLKLCQSFDMHIANGYVPGDRLGNFTCFTSKGSSVVDFVIGDSNSINLINRLHVLPPNFCSVHCPLSFVIKGGTLKCPLKKSLDPKPIKFKWDPNLEGKFVAALKDAGVSSLETSFPATSKEVIEETAEKLVKSLLTAANRSLVIVSPKSYKPGRMKHKKWFNKDCQYLKRRLNNLAKLLMKFPKDPFIRGNFITIKKQYRKSVKSAKFSFQQCAVERLCNLANNPKEFWSYTKKLMGKSPQDCAVSDED